jgi:calcineurin-like phosphoesterase family protein
MANVFFTADPHYGHENIIRHSKRPFANYEEMDEQMIENWNRKVTKPSDMVYVLGDFTFYSKVLITDPKSVFNRLRGQKFLIRGNHDKDYTLRLPWGWVKDTYFLKGYNETGIWQSHYAHRSWKNSFHGSWHLFGHTHNMLPPYGLSFDCGVDGNNFELWHIDEVAARMKTLDHSLII